MSVVQSFPEHLLDDLQRVVDATEQEADWLKDALKIDGDRLWRHCRALSASDADADDLLHETLLRAMLKPPERRTEPMLPWLKTVARHIAIDSHRARREIPTEHLPEPSEPHRGEESAREAVDAALIEAIAGLSLGQLAVFLLRTLLDLSAEEVAALVGSNAGAVRVSAHRARAIVREGGGKTKQRAVSEFLECVCAQRLTGLDDLLRAAGHPQARVALAGPAPRRVWERLIEAAGALFSENSPEEAAMLSWSRAASLQRQGDLIGSDAAYTEALARSRERGLDGVAARALLGLAKNALDRGDDETISALRTEIREPPGDEDPDGMLLRSIDSGRLWRRGDYREAQEAYLGMLEREEDPERTATLLHNAALVGAYTGDLDAAWPRAMEALNIYERLHDEESAATACNTIGMIAQNRGELLEASAWFHRAVARAQQPSLALALLKPQTNLGLVAHERGYLREAATIFIRVADQARALSGRRTEAIARANLGVTWHAAGLRRRAQASLHVAADLSGHPGPLRLFIEAHTAAVTALDDPERSLLELQRLQETLATREEMGLGTVISVLLAWCRLRAGALTLEALGETLERARAEAAHRSSAARIAIDLVRRLVINPGRAS